MRIVKTTLLLSDNGKEFDTGRITRKTAYLATISKEEALKRFKEHKRVYFIYEDERIFHENCRKVATNASYIRHHYEVYFECCGYLATKNRLSDQEYDVLNSLAHKSGMDCWFSLRKTDEKDQQSSNYVRDLESDNILSLSDGLTLFAEGLLKLDSCGLSKVDLETATILFDRFGLLEQVM